jgi:hypothetical protein
VLSNIEVSHAPNGFNVFTTADAPQSVALSLTFKEIFPLNKEVIMNFGNPSMTPEQLVLEESQSTSQSDKAVETSVSAEQAGIAKQISQQAAVWKAKDIQRNKLVKEREEAESYAPFRNRLPKINNEIDKLEVDMNLIKTEVDVLIPKANKQIPPLPLRP